MMENWNDFVTPLEEEEDCDSSLRTGEGPPVGSLAWPTPTLFQAKLTSIKAYDHRSKAARTIDNVLTSGRDPDTAYLIRTKISKTTFGTVRCCVVLRKRGDDEPNVEEVPWISTEELVAVKISSWNKMRQNKGKQLEDPVREVAALQLVGNQYPHILGCHEVMQDEKHLYIIMPYYSKGSNLHGRLFSDPDTPADTRLPPPSEDEARKIFRQLLKGLLELQRKGIAHRDISLDNLLISKTNELKIVDLEMSLRVPYSDACNEGCITDVSEGTVRRLIKKQAKGKRLMYLAPEVIAEKEAFDGFAVDLWAAGVILFVLCVGLAPFKLADPSDKRYAKISGGGLKSLMKSLRISVSPEACDLIQRMLREDPRNRLSLIEVMKHPWVMGEKIPGEEPSVAGTISCEVSVGSESSTEPTHDAEHESSLTLKATNKSHNPDILSVEADESRQSPSESRDSIAETVHQGTQRLARNIQQLGPKLKTNAQHVANNAQRIGPKLKKAITQVHLPPKLSPTKGASATLNRLKAVIPHSKTA